MAAEKDPPLESGDMQAAIQLLTQQIERGRQLLRLEHPSPEQCDRWNRDGENVLIRVYGDRSPNVTSIVRSAGDTAVWLGMPANTLARYRRSAVEIRVRKMQNCVAALREKAARPAA